MERKGFFSFNKRTMFFILLVLLLVVIMFTPPVFYASTAVGTSMQFVFVNIILFVAPTFAIVDGLLRGKHKSSKNNKSELEKGEE